MLHLLSLESVRWRHNERDGVSNHQPHDCLPDRLFWRRSKKSSKLRVTGLCEGKAENVSILWRHHEKVGFFRNVGSGIWENQCSVKILSILSKISFSHMKRVVKYDHRSPSTATGIVVVPRVRPSVRPSRTRYRSIALKISIIGLKLGGMMHSIMKQIAF